MVGFFSFKSPAILTPGKWKVVRILMSPARGKAISLPGEDLNRRAKLTFVSQVLAQAAQLLSGLCFTPIIVHGLNQELYGAWGMITSLLGFLGLANLNATSILKLVLGVRQHNPDVAEKRRLIGAALWQWGVLLPIILIAGTLLVFFAPRLVPTSPENFTAVYWTMALMVLNVPLMQLCSLPASVLSGQNLNYKAMGLNAAMVIVGGALNALGVLAGFGLVILAITTLIGILLVNGARLYVVRRNVPWFGIERPRPAEIRTMIRLSIPGTLGTAAGGLLSSADVLLFGYFFGTGAASIYMITGALIRYAVTPFQQLLGSGNAGIGFLVGKGEWPRLAALRLELHQTALWGFGVIGALVLTCNHLFVHFWVGDRFYGGLPLELGIVLCAFFRQMAQIDAIPLDASLRLYPKVTTMIVWSILGLAAGWGLAGLIGPAGIPLGMALGQSGLWASYQFLLRRYTGLPVGRHVRHLARAFAVFGVTLSGWVLLRWFHPLAASTWWGLAGKSMLIALLAGIAGGFLGLSSPVRLRLWQRIGPSQFFLRR
jgi:O-antigen/teichoic acid export membrane protein